MIVLGYVEILVLKYAGLKNVKNMMLGPLRYFLEMRKMRIVSLSYWKIASM
jgi:hypothetical protein